MWDVIEHVNNPQMIVDRAHQMLRPGGVLLIDTPNRDGIAYRFGEWTAWMTRGAMASTMGIQYSATPYCHKQIFRASDMRRMLRGFATISIDERTELSFPTEYYLRGFIADQAIRKVAARLADAALCLIPLRNKLIVSAIKG